VLNDSRFDPHLHSWQLNLQSKVKGLKDTENLALLVATEVMQSLKNTGERLLPIGRWLHQSLNSKIRCHVPRNERNRLHTKHLTFWIYGYRHFQNWYYFKNEMNDIYTQILAAPFGCCMCVKKTSWLIRRIPYKWMVCVKCLVTLFFSA
jgi:hypothetical protein